MKNENYKHIIFFYPSFEKGGVEKILITLIKFFLKKKFKLTLISSKINIKIDDKNFNHHLLKKHKNRLHSIYGAMIALKEKLKEQKKKNLNKNTIVFSLQSNSAAIIISKLFNTKIIIRNSEYILGGLISKDENIIKTLFTLFQKIIFYNLCNYIIANSKGSELILKRILFLKKIKYIYNPYLKKVNKINNLKRKNNILFVGRFVRQKGIFFLLKAFKLLKIKNYNYKLILVGDGPDKKKIKKFIELNDLKKDVKIINWTKNLSKYYLSSKIFVLPSLYEGLGNVVIESLNFFTPTLVSNCKSGPSEIILNGKAGYIFKKKDTIDLLRNIIKIDKNYDQAKKKAVFGNKSLNRFLINSQCEKYLKILNKI